MICGKLITQLTFEKALTNLSKTKNQFLPFFFDRVINVLVILPRILSLLWRTDKESHNVMEQR